MSVIILAAGKGTRLQPLSSNLPKCRVEFQNKTLLDWQLDVWASLGINDVHAVVGHRADQIEVPGRRYVNQEYASTNMLYSLMQARELFESGEDVIVSYGDIIFEERVASKIIEDHSDIGIAVDLEWLRLWSCRMDDPLEDCETLRMSDVGEVIEIGHSPKTLEEVEAQYIGLMRFSPAGAASLISHYDALNSRGVDVRRMDMTSFLQSLIDDGIRVSAVPIQNGWLEFDTPEDHAAYTSAVENHPRWKVFSAESSASKP